MLGLKYVCHCIYKIHIFTPVELKKSERTKLTKLKAYKHKIIKKYDTVIENKIQLKIQKI